MIVLSDIDDVVADFVPNWLRKYNKQYNDTLKKSKILNWNVSEFIKEKENKDRLYEYLNDPKLYDDVVPIKNALWGINELRNMGHRVIFVTGGGYPNRKFQWLSDHGFQPTKDNYVEILNKYLIKGDWLIDDGYHNIVTFPNNSLTCGITKFTIVFIEFICYNYITSTQNIPIKLIYHNNTMTNFN